MFIINLILALIGFGILAVASEFVMKGVERFSQNAKISRFATSFIILGFLTSLSELSVGLNAVLERTPEVFVGNLIGASFVILILIVPLLAIFNKGVYLKDHLSNFKLFCFLLMTIIPSLLILDGEVNYLDSLIVLAAAGGFYYLIQKDNQSLDEVKTEKNPKALVKDILQIAGGAFLIFLASKLLVDTTIYFAEFFKIPSFLISILVLSIGTNIPEIAIAIRSVKVKMPDIAFGDYVGSVTMNIIIFGLMSLFHGPFKLTTSGFNVAFFILMAGYILFFFFARTKNRISPMEGMVLLLVYVVFLAFETIEFITLSVG